MLSNQGIASTERQRSPGRRGRRTERIVNPFLRSLQRLLRRAVPDDKRKLALAWLFQVVGDITVPLQAVQLFTRKYPNGDGGGKRCTRVAQNRAALSLRLRNGLLSNIAFKADSRPISGM